MCCCNGRILPASTQEDCLNATATGSAPSTTISKGQRPWPWGPCSPRLTLPAPPLTEQRIAIFGAGSAGMGIATLLLTAMKNAGLSEAEACRRFYAVDKDGLLVEGMAEIRPTQQPFVQPRSAITEWNLDQKDHISLLDVVRNAKPTTLIGVSGQAGAFTEEVIRAMAASVDRPVIFPLSNP